MLTALNRDATAYPPPAGYPAPPPGGDLGPKAPTNDHIPNSRPDASLTEFPKPRVTAEEEDFQDALATLMWRTLPSDRSLFDHVSAMIREIYTNNGNDELWSNKLDLLSRLVKRKNVPPVSMHFIKPGYVNSPDLATFQKIRDLFLPFDEENVKPMDHNGPMPAGIGYIPPDGPLEKFPPLSSSLSGNDEEDELKESEERRVYRPIDMYEWLFYAQESGLGISQTEMYLAMTAILRFQKANFNELQKMRFWGKVQGSERAYYVLECQFKEMSEKWYELPPMGDQRQQEGDGHKPTVYNPFGTVGMREDFDETFFTLNLVKFPIPYAPVLDPDQHFKEVMPEESSSGANMFCYYVCDDLIKADWYRLPDVTPEQIRKARFIRRGFTGNLNTKMVTCPTFPGSERNYLRAQIARISHSTTIGPLGQYTPPDEDEDTLTFKLIENPEFEHPNMRDILAKNLSGYAHNLPYLLRQGRCSWYDPSPNGFPLSEDEEDGEQEEEEEEEEEEPESNIRKNKLVAKLETGPAVFTPVTEDREVAKDVPAWVAKVTNTCLPQNGVVKLCSTLWPGAVCIVQNDKSENFYVGDGVTKSTEFAPFMPPVPQQVFNQSLKSLQHAGDPAPELEEEQRLKKEATEKAKLEAAQAALEDAENTEEDEEDDEGEDEEEEDEETG